VSNQSAQLVEMLASAANGSGVPGLLAKYGQEMPVFETEQGTPGACYETAVQTAMGLGLPYAEGYAIHGELIPMAHAWNLNEEDQVVDLTWGEGHSYYGVVIPWDVVVEVMSETGVYGVLCNLWLLETDHAHQIVEKIKEANS
jgi:hypothetical protein